jgi:hypothetical protein
VICLNREWKDIIRKTLHDGENQPFSSGARNEWITAILKVKLHFSEVLFTPWRFIFSNRKDAEKMQEKNACLY